MADRKKMEGYCSTGQSPQWAVVPIEEEEEEEYEEEKEEEEEDRKRRRRRRSCLSSDGVCELRHSHAAIL